MKTGCSTVISTVTPRCLFGVTGKKIRRFPVNTGVTSLGVCLRNETVERTTTEFMKAIGYQGILDIGYRYDQRDGQYKVLDVNPRIGCTFRLFTATNGMDVARALYLDMTGQPVAPAQAAEGRKWMVEDFDLVSAIRSWRDRTLKLKDWVKSFRGVEETACFALDDPLPFLLMGCGGLLRVVPVVSLPDGDKKRWRRRIVFPRQSCYLNPVKSTTLLREA